MTGPVASIRVVYERNLVSAASQSADGHRVILRVMKTDSKKGTPMTAGPSTNQIDTAQFLTEQIDQASPDLLLELLTTRVGST